MSRWTSKGAILRDLSRAQGGCGAPDQLRDTLGAADRPPALSILEETEEEYFQLGMTIAEGEAVARPDLGLIQKMLDMVRELNVSEDEGSADEGSADDGAVISKLSAAVAEFIPPSGALVARSTPPATSAAPPRKTKRVRQRNVALESILGAIQNQQNNNDVRSNGEPLRLLKPEHFIPNLEENITETPSTTCIQNDKLWGTDQPHKDTQTFDPEQNNEVPEKGNDWMTRMTSPIRTESTKRAILSLDSSTMFKKKTGRDSATSTPTQATAQQSTHRRTDEKAYVPSSQAYVPSSQAYVPSSQAGHYYRQYVEKDRLAESIHDDIWTKAEKIMKEIDVNKCLEAERRAARPEPAAEGAHELETEGARDLEVEGARDLEAEGARDLEEVARDLEAEGACDLEAEGARVLETEGARALEAARRVAPPARHLSEGVAPGDPMDRVRLPVWRHALSAPCAAPCCAACRASPPRHRRRHRPSAHAATVRSEGSARTSDGSRRGATR